MSIATLKRKTQTKYNNMSVGTDGFSINGVFRNQGYVGQPSLTRSLCINSTEDSNTVKKSVLGTSGMLSSKYRWIRRPQPYSTVKPDINNNNSDQSTYITKKIKKTMNEIKKGNDPDDTTCTNINSYTPSSCVNNKNVCENIRDESDYLPISSGEYISQLNDACQENDIATTRPVCGQPLPGL